MSLPWYRKDSNTFANNKVRRLVKQRNGWRAYAVWDFAIGYSTGQGTDGHIEPDDLDVIHGTEAIAALLVDAGLFDVDAERGGWVIHNYTKRNPTAAESDAKRMEKRIAGLKSQCVQRHGDDCGCWKEKASALTPNG